MDIVHENVVTVSSTSQKWTTTTTETNKILELENANKIVGLAGELCDWACSMSWWSVCVRLSYRLYFTRMPNVLLRTFPLSLFLTSFLSSFFLPFFHVLFLSFFLSSFFSLFLTFFLLPFFLLLSIPSFLPFSLPSLPFCLVFFSSFLLIVDQIPVEKPFVPIVINVIIKVRHGMVWHGMTWHDKAYHSES